MADKFEIAESGVLVMPRKDYWGSMATDYIPKRGSMCAQCCRQTDLCNNTEYICDADYDIKYNYKYGRIQDAIELLRDLPSELLKDYLDEEYRTPVNLKVVILDELECRGEYEKMREAMRL